MTMAWKVHVDRAPLMDVVKVYLYNVIGDEVEVVQADGTLRRTGYGTAPSDGDGLMIPSDAWEALAEHAAGESRLGAENRVLREWLQAERSRVDNALRPGSL